MHGGLITGLTEITDNAALKDLAGDKAQVNALVASAQVVDVLKRFPASLSADQLIALLRPLTPASTPSPPPRARWKKRFT